MVDAIFRLMSLPKPLSTVDDVDDCSSRTVLLRISKVTVPYSGLIRKQKIFVEDHQKIF